MSKRLALTLTLLLLTAAGCASSSTQREGDSEASADPATESEETRAQKPEMAAPKADWVDDRVEKSRQRLSGTEAGKLVWKSIKAHGGLKTWYANGPVYFRYTYSPVGDRTGRDTYQTVDTWSSRARHQLADDRAKEYGWDGEAAWKKPADWKPPYDVRFWALTPYYFMGMPFVLADPGVNLSLEEPDTIEGTEYRVIRVTFGEVGIAPDDYYVLYIDPDTHQLAALRYVVSYPKYFPKGGHSDEKLMTYDGTQTVDGITFANSYRFFMWKPDKKTDARIVTNAKLRNVEFRPDTPDSFFDIPEEGTSLEEKEPERVAAD